VTTRLYACGFGSPSPPLPPPAAPPPPAPRPRPVGAAGSVAVSGRGAGAAARPPPGCCVGAAAGCGLGCEHAAITASAIATRIGNCRIVTCREVGGVGVGPAGDPMKRTYCTADPLLEAGAGASSGSVE